MNTTENTPRFLGAAFLFQAIASVVWGIILLEPLIVPGNIIASMTNIADNTSQMRASIVVAMFTAMGVAILGALLYVVLHKQNRKIALIAFGLYLIEAAILAASRMRLSLSYVQVKNP